MGAWGWWDLGFIAAWTSPGQPGLFLARWPQGLSDTQVVLTLKEAGLEALKLSTPAANGCIAGENGGDPASPALEFVGQRQYE